MVKTRALQRFVSAVAILAILACVPAAAQVHRSTIEGIETPTQLVEWVAERGLTDANLKARTQVCLADHLPAHETNRLMLMRGWPGPFFETPGRGSARILEAPVLEIPGWQEKGEVVSQLIFRFAVDANGRARGATLVRGEAPPETQKAVRRMLKTWRFEPAHFAGEPGVVCREQTFVLPRHGSNTRGQLTPRMIEEVTTEEQLFEVLDKTDALRSDLRTRSAICWLDSEVFSRELSQKLFAYGWPGPFIGSPGMELAKILERGRQPSYPEEVRLQRIEGVATVRYVVDAGGVPRYPVIIRPLDPRLDESLLESVRQNTFRPAGLFGQPVSSCRTMSTRFRLQ